MFYRVLFRVGVQYLSFFPVVKSIIDKSSKDDIIVEVWSIWISVEVDWMQEDAKTICRESRDGVGEGDTVAFGSSRGQQWTLHQGRSSVRLVVLGNGGCLEENISSIEGIGVIMVMPGSSNPEGVIPLGGCPG